MKPLIWAHRGARAYAPENTIEAFKLAVEQGADGIELDVHLSRDGEIVVTHDEWLERVSGVKGKVSDYTLEELKSFNFCAVFPEIPAKLPTLREVYELILPTGLTVNVEIKNKSEGAYEGLEEKLIALERESGMTGRVWYSSFNHYSLLKVREIDPQAKTGLLYNSVLVDADEYAARVGADAIHPYYPAVAAPELVAGCREKGIRIHPWTVNDAEVMKRLALAGVDALITDVPDVARKTVG